MDFTKATDKQIHNIVKFDKSCPPSLLRGAVLEMLDRGLFDKLIADCIHHVTKDIEKMEQVHKVGLDDFLQIGRIEVIKALEDFDPTRGRTFISYIYMKIKSELINEITVLEAQKRDNRKVTSYNRKTESGAELIEFFSDKRENVEKYVVNKVTVEQLLTRVNEHQRNVMLYRLKGYTFAEISKILGRGNDRTMHQAFKLAVNKMKKGA